MSAADENLGPISPELALVDPELAEAARARLPEPGGPVVRPAPVELPAPVERPRRRRRRRAPVVLVLVALAAAAAAVAYAVRDRSSTAAPVVVVDTDPPHPPRVTTRTTAPTVPQPAPVPKPKPKPKPAPTVPHPAPKPKPKPPPTVPRPAPKPKPKPKPAAKPGFVPARTWTWAPVAGATAYRITFLRGGATFYRATTRGSVLRLPARIRFTPGRYTWTVVPVVRGRERPATVRSTFTVG